MCIGAGNHRSFMLFLSAACVSIAIGVFAACKWPPPPLPTVEAQAAEASLLRAGARPVERRLHVLGVGLGVVVVLPLLVLAFQQWRKVFANVLTVEEDRWDARHPESAGECFYPTREDGEAVFREYAPFDTGDSARNAVDFCRGTRRLTLPKR